MIERLTSSNNRYLKLAASLKQRKYRDEYNCFAVEGVRLVEEALESGAAIRFAVYDGGAAASDDRLQAAVRRLNGAAVRLCEVDAALYARISDTKGPQGLMAVVGKAANELADIVFTSERSLLLVLDRLQDPGNVGAIIRVADAAGCAGVVLLRDTADVFASKTVRATMGSLFHLPVVPDVAAEDLVDFLQTAAVPLYVTALDRTAVSVFAVDWRGANAVVFSNEGGGASEYLLQKARRRLFIPMRGQAESLNVAAAAAVVAYESLRQNLSYGID